MPKDDLEGRFLNLLANHRIRLDAARLFRRIILEVWNGERVGDRKALEAQRQRARKLETDKARLLDLLLNGLIDEDTYKTRMAKIKAEIEQAETDEHACNANDLDPDGILAFAEPMLLEPAKCGGEALYETDSGFRPFSCLKA